MLAAMLLTQSNAQDLYTLDYIQEAGESGNFNDGAIRFIITPQQGYKWGKAYNAKLRLKRNKNVALPKRFFSNKKNDFVQKENTIIVSIPFDIRGMEDEVVKGTLSFLLCNKKVCKPQRNIKVQFQIFADGC